MSDTWTPPVGAFGLSRIGIRSDGRLTLLGALIAAGQAITGDGSRYTHAFVVVDGGSVVEAMPSGARLAPLAHRIDDEHIVWCDTPVQEAIEEYATTLGLDTADEEATHAGYHMEAGHLAVGDDQAAQLDAFERNLRMALAAEARGLVGARYGFSDYLALTLANFGVRAGWLRRYITRSGRLICSQLVDEVYRRQGIHLFDDNRLPQDVTPGDLDLYRLERALQPFMYYDPSGAGTPVIVWQRPARPKSTGGSGQ